MVKKLIYGVGVSSDGKYERRKNGKSTRHYSLWKGMLERGFSEKLHKKYPSYIGIQIDARWLDYQPFANDIDSMIGFNEKDEKGKVFELDKDLLGNGKLYSKDTCCFIPHAINTFLANKQNNKGEYPTGICWHKGKNMYQAYTNVNGKLRYLGYFTKLEDAIQVYKINREQYAKYLAERYKTQIDERAYEYLMNYVED